MAGRVQQNHGSLQTRGPRCGTDHPYLLPRRTEVLADARRRAPLAGSFGTRSIRAGIAGMTCQVGECLAQCRAGIARRRDLHRG